MRSLTGAVLGAVLRLALVYVFFSRPARKRANAEKGA